MTWDTCYATAFVILFHKYISDKSETYTVCYELWTLIISYSTCKNLPRYTNYGTYMLSVCLTLSPSLLAPTQLSFTLDIKSLYTVDSTRKGLLALSWFLAWSSTWYLYISSTGQTCPLPQLLLVSKGVLQTCLESGHGNKNGFHICKLVHWLCWGPVILTIHWSHSSAIWSLYQWLYWHDHTLLDSFLPFLQSFHPSPKFSCTLSYSSIEFLKISVSIHHSTLTNSSH